MIHSKREDEGEMSIEEILASIRRYVGDDAQMTSEKAPSTLRLEADKAAEALAASLASSKPSETGASAASTIPAASVLPGLPPENVIRLTEAHAVRSESQDSPVVSAATEPLLSQEIQTSTARAFSRLAETAAQLHHQAATPSVSSPTLDQLFTELARPLIKQWIDQNLSRLVEITITKEIERLTQNLYRG